MGWRDRMRNNSAYSAEIAYRNEKIKKDEDNNKLRSKTSFSIYTQITQNTQNTQSEVKEEVAESPPAPRQPLAETDNAHADVLHEPAVPQKITSKVEHQSPPDIANVSNPPAGNCTNSPDPWDLSHIENQQNKIPEKNEEKSELLDLKKAGAMYSRDDAKAKKITASIKPDHIPVSPIEGRIEYTQANCPARCKETGKCYGTAWFDCQPGPSRPCTPKKCPWEDRFNKRGRDWR